MAGLVEPRSAAIAKQPRLLELDAGFRDPALHRIVLNHRPAEGGALGGAHRHQLDQQFTEADRAHAMVNARRPEADLRDLEPFALVAKQILAGHAHIVEGQFADRCDMILAAHPGQPPYQANTGRRHRHDDAGMAARALGA